MHRAVGGIGSQRKKPTQPRSAQERPLYPAAYRVYRMLLDTQESQSQVHFFCQMATFYSFSSSVTLINFSLGPQAWTLAKPFFFLPTPFLSVLTFPQCLLYSQRGGGGGGGGHFSDAQRSHVLFFFFFFFF